MWNRRPISVLIRPRVHRWSLANPCASGPFRSSSSSRAHCRGLSFSRDTGPLDRSASAPPSCQARCHRRTDPSVTRKSRAISLIVSPQANLAAACSRSRSRRCCSAGVYPPCCAYRMHPSYARNQPTSRPALYELILVSRARSSPPRWVPGAADLGPGRPRRNLGADRPAEPGRAAQPRLAQRLGALPASPHRRAPGCAVPDRRARPPAGRRPRRGSGATGVLAGTARMGPNTATGAIWRRTIR